MKKFVKYIVTMLVGLAAAFCIMLAKGLFEQPAPYYAYAILCDAFFVVGGLMTLWGLLIFCSNEGAFDGLVYSVTSFFSFFKRNVERKYATYYDYKQSRKGKKVKFLYLVLCGLVFLAVSLVMYLLYRQNIPPYVQAA